MAYNVPALQTGGIDISKGIRNAAMINQIKAQKEDQVRLPEIRAHEAFMRGAQRRKVMRDEQDYEMQKGLAKTTLAQKQRERQMGLKRDFNKDVLKIYTEAFPHVENLEDYKGFRNMIFNYKSKSNYANEPGVDLLPNFRMGMPDIQTEEEFQDWRKKVATAMLDVSEKNKIRDIESREKIAAGKSKTGKEFAPDMDVFVNSETGEDMVVNTRSKADVQKALDKGFSPLNPEERGYLLGSGKASSDRETEINKEAGKARVQMHSLTTLDNLLDRFESGKLAKIGMGIQQYAEAVGLDIDVSGLAAKEAYESLVKRMALESRNLGEGMVLAGQMSDRDVRFLEDMNPQLVRSKMGNRVIIRMRKKMVERQTDVSKLMRQFKKENKGIFRATEFEDYLEENLANVSVFGIPEGSVLAVNSETGEELVDPKTGLPAYVTPEGKLILPEF